MIPPAAGEGEALRTEDNQTLRTEDHQARRAAQRVFEVPLALEAGAGTGKTTTLVARLLAWSLGAGWEKALAGAPAEAGDPVDSERTAAAVLGGVVAITFTEAAAAEMASRAARELARLARGEPVPGWLEADVLPAEPGERARRAGALLATLDHLSVRTIHAFCRGLLADHPLEAGVHPDLTIDADGLLVEEVVREVVEGTLRAGYGHPGDPELLALAGAGHGPQEIAEALEAMIRAGLPAAALAEDPFGPAPLAAFRERLGAALSGLHELVAPSLATAGRAKNARELAAGLETLLGRLTALGGEPGAGVETLQAWAEELFPPNLAEHLRKWGRGSFNGSEAEAFGGSREEIAACSLALARLLEHLRRLDSRLLGHARRALRPLLAAVERELRSRGIATFDFLLTAAAALLAGNPEVRRRVRGRIDQLLVDEFQDTDATQCALLGWIALDGPPERRPGLFLVGDPKQSIYGWRSADLRAYEGFVERLVAAGGSVRTLAENFRSVPAILDEVARAVEPVMVERSGLQPPFQPLLPCERRVGDPGFLRSSPHGSWAPVEHWVSWKEEEEEGGRTRVVEAAELEAAALAEDVRALAEREGVRWGEIAVLLRGTGDLDVYLEAFRRVQVPFAVGRDKQYFRRREVIEAAALVRAILDPGDHLALLTTLRSSAVGVPDAALIPLWNRELPRRVTELAGPDPESDRSALAALREAVEGAAAEVPRDVPGIERLAGWERNLLAFLESLAVLRRSFDTEPGDVFVERLRRLLLIEAVESARYLGPYRLANLDRFFRQLLQAIEGGDVTGILRTLRRSVAEAREAEEGRPSDGSGDAVQVLTIHGAKGLDFEHVYLVQLHKDSGGDRRPGTDVGRAVDRAGGGGFEYRLFGAPTLGFDLVEAERREVEAAERVRLLYVAMTRAKDRLVLAGLWPHSPGHSPGQPPPPEQARTHLDLLRWRPGSPADLAERWRAAGDGGPWAFTDETGALWKLPARRPAPEAGLGAEPERPGLPDLEEIRQVSRSLAEARLRAAARMDRPFLGAASEEAHARLREEQAERRSGDAAGRLRAGEGSADREAPPGREALMAAGGAVHRALENWDLAAEPAAESERQRALLPSYLAALADDEAAEQALPVAAELLDRLAQGRLLARLRALGGHVLARELPVLLPPRWGDAEGDASPVGAVTGAVDLLYRDPETGRLVVADYKTDDLAGDEELARRAETYAPQGALYARAVQEALGLPEPPRFELWFLRADRVVAA
jgi:ATP-dependent helicase/nuclease subunit A